MVPILKVKNRYEFDEMIRQQNFSISKSIVEGILSNINTKKKHINVLTVDFIEENEALDITLEKKHFKQTLEENIQHYEKNEMYEECFRIQEAISKLNKNI